jgi:hypothetical protein
MAFGRQPISARRKPEGSGQPILFRLGKAALQVLGLLGTDARRQAILTFFDEPAHNAFHPTRRFPFAKDNFRMAAAAVTFEIDLSEAKVGQRACR